MFGAFITILLCSPDFKKIFKTSIILNHIFSIVPLNYGLQCHHRSCQWSLYLIPIQWFLSSLDPLPLPSYQLHGYNSRPSVRSACAYFRPQAYNKILTVITAIVYTNLNRTNDPETTEISTRSAKLKHDSILYFLLMVSQIFRKQVGLILPLTQYVLLFQFSNWIFMVDQIKRFQNRNADAF